MFRRLILWIAGRCLRWVYRDHRVIGGEQVPATGPVLLVGNHPNDLPDVLTGYLVTPRPVRYVATVSVTSSWAARTTYEGLGVIPVVRVRDARKMKQEGVDLTEVNQAAGSAVAQALGSGEVVGVFPEGGVHDVPEIGRLRTGVAKMVLDFLDTDAKNDVTIVPFGVQYEAPRRVGSDMMAIVGEPWSARAFVTAPDGDGKGVAGFTGELRRSLRAVTRNSTSWSEAELRDQIITAVAAISAPRDPFGATSALVAQAEAMAADACGDGPSAIAVRLRTAVRALAEAVDRAGGIGTSALDHARLLFALDVHKAQAPVPGIVLFIGGPAAAIGWLVHGPVFALIAWLAPRLAKDRAEVVARMFVPGLYLVALWYGVVAVGLGVALWGWGWSPLWALLVVPTLPRFGDLAVGWRTWLNGWLLVERVHKWSTPERMALRSAAATVAECWALVAAARDD